MQVKNNALSRLFLIRITFPLIFLAALWSSPEPHLFISGLFVLNVLDFLGGITQLVWQPHLLDYRFAAMRDVTYALVYYLIVVHNPQMPALALVPSALAEVFVLFGNRVFFRAVLIEIAMLAVRMVFVYHALHHLHPAWAILIVTASVVMGLLGLEISRLEELQVNITRQQEELKGTLTEMLTIMLSPNGIDEKCLNRENIGPMIDEICKEADQSKGREIGQRLAQVIAVRQDASNLLTSRELEVLNLVAGDKSYRQVAELLQVSEGTIRAHAASIMRKAEVHNRHELILWARKHQLLPSIQVQDPSGNSSEIMHS